MVKNILIGCTGSVATIKLAILIKTFFEINKNIEIRVIVTEHAKHFFKHEDIPSGVKIFEDQIEWSEWKKRGDPIWHIELIKWADAFVIAPLDANTLAKIANGICDNLLTSAVRAWDRTKSLFFCPAMNTKMWEHPITTTQIALLESWNYVYIPCISKTLVCGDTGLGAMAEVDVIVKEVCNKLLL